MHVEQRDGGGRDPGDAASLGDADRALPVELLFHLVAQANDGVIIEIVGHATIFQRTESLIQEHPAFKGRLMEIRKRIFAARKDGRPNVVRD